MGQTATESRPVHGVLSATKSRVGHEGVKGRFRMDFSAQFRAGFGRLRTVKRVSLDPFSAQPSKLQTSQISIKNALISHEIRALMVGEGGFAFLRKSHGPANMPPACLLGRPFRIHLYEYRNRAPQMWCPVSGGGRWIRTTEVTDNRFTVCPLWPLGNSPIFSCIHRLRNIVSLLLAAQPSEADATRKGRRRERIWSFPRQREAEWSELLLTLELVDGLEPPTC